MRHISLADATPAASTLTPAGPLIAVRGLKSQLLRSAASSNASALGAGQKVGAAASAGTATASAAGEQQDDVLYEIQWQADAPVSPLVASKESTASAVSSDLQLSLSSAPTSPAIVSLVAAALVALQSALSSKLDVGLSTAALGEGMGSGSAWDAARQLAGAGLHALMRTLMQVGCVYEMLVCA